MEHRIITLHSVYTIAQLYKWAKMNGLENYYLFITEEDTPTPSITLEIDDNQKLIYL